ncbi:hypothetical protein Ancab_012566 [Ancistrocladus abbreviatus]
MEIVEEKKMNKIKQFKGKNQLPKFAIPKSYNLSLKPDLLACTFTGSVQISVSIIEQTSVLVLNVLELSIHQACFIDSSATEVKQFRPSDVVVDGDDEILVLVFDEVLGVGDGVLEINFSGVLNDYMMGFYRGTYLDGGEKKNMASTQFEAVDARRCFPCWDEPALKATFNVTLVVPSELTALSNMPISSEEHHGHLKTVHFEESPLMSTYLVAFVVGSFDYVEDTTVDGVKVRAYCPIGESDRGRFCLSIALNALDFFTKYFSMPYPLPKLDMVAVPDFSAGAMENYGLIIYRAVELLQDDVHSAAANKQRAAIVVAHEVAHQWFGNLVTMQWWTHLWLNEGFATWISYLAVDNFFPEWRIWTQFLEETSDGLRQDSLEQSHPIEVEIGHASTVDEVFDAISYCKGSAVIRMLQDYLGDETFRKSLSSYMKKYACKNAKTEDLWRVLSEEAGFDVSKMMDTWTKQMGYPLISVKLVGQSLEFEQSHFLSSGQQGHGQWIVPLSFATGSYTKCWKFLLETKFGSFDISNMLDSSKGNSGSSEDEIQGESGEDIWLKVNVDQAGFYRVKYEDKLASLLNKAIQNNFLSAADKFGILDDTYALCQACEVPFSSLLSLIDVYKDELDYIVLSRLIDICISITTISMDAIPDTVDGLKQFFINLLCSSAEKLGWDPKSGESHLDSLLRGKVLKALATFGDEKTQKEAMTRFKAFMDDTNTLLLPPDTREAAYVAVIRNSNVDDRKGLRALLSIYRQAEAAQEKNRVLRTIASSADPNIVSEALDLVLSNEVREQDVIFVLRGISLEGREIAWRWMKDNWEVIKSKWGPGRSMLLTRFVRSIPGVFSSHQMADEVDEFFTRHPNPSIAMTVNQSIEKIRIKARWVNHIKQEPSLQELINRLAGRG